MFPVLRPLSPGLVIDNTLTPSYASLNEILFFAKYYSWRTHSSIADVEQLLSRTKQS